VQQVVSTRWRQIRFSRFIQVKGLKFRLRNRKVLDYYARVHLKRSREKGGFYWWVTRGIAWAAPVGSGVADTVNMAKMKAVAAAQHDARHKDLELRGY
jgi:hypothetical protein